MLSDKSGHELKLGDRVYIPCIITAVNANQENDLSVEVEDAVGPGRAKTALVINSKQVICGARPDHTRGTPDKDDVPKHK